MSFSKFPPEGISSLDENQYVGRKDSGTGIGAAINYTEVGDGPIITQAQFTAMLASGGTGSEYDEMLHVELADGATVEITDYLVPAIYSYTRISSNPQNPARIKFVGTDRASVPALCYLHGRDIVLENLIFDLNNIGPQYVEGITGIRFTEVAGSSNPPMDNMENIIIRNLVVTDSNPPINRYVDYNDPNSGRLTRDNWFITLTHISTVPATNVLIENLTHCTRPFMQLIAAGYGEGFDGLTIRNNYCDRCEVGSIAVTNSGMAAGDVKTFRNVTISDNIIMNAFTHGIYVGNDNQPGIQEVAIELLTIERNYIQMSSFYEFATPVFLRADGDGHMSDIAIRENVLDTSEAVSPRMVNISNPATAPLVNVIMDGNDYHGPGDIILNNAAVVSARSDPHSSIDNYIIDDSATITGNQTVEGDATITGATTIGGDVTLDSIIAASFLVTSSANAIFKLGAIDGTSSLIVRDGLSVDQATVNDRGQSFFAGDMGVGIQNPDARGHFHQAVTSGGIVVSSENYGQIKIVSDYDGSSGGPWEVLFSQAANSEFFTVQLQGQTEMQLGSGKFLITNLPTSDPARAGQLWVDLVATSSNDAGTVKVSAG